MACFHPLEAFRSPDRTKNGKLGISFNPARGYIDKPIKLPCGQCIGCRLERSRQWAMRCMYEASLHESNCFITLTYSPDKLPPGGTLRKRDFQLFIKKLRKRFGTFRYFHCGEYGEALGRPHYHALLFGFDFPDKVRFNPAGRSSSAPPLYTSDLLDSIWGNGLTSIGAVTFETAAYTARYVMKKVTGKLASKHYERVIPETGEIYNLQPEYISMSLKPAIASDWYKRFKSDVYPSDFLVFNNQKMRPPKYFDKLYDITNPDDLELLKLRRVKAASKFKADNTPARLADREHVQNAQLSQLKRHKEI